MSQPDILRSSRAMTTAPLAPKLKRNTVINSIGYIAPILVALLTVPAYLSVIGKERYGVLMVVWIFLDYFGLFDMGISRAATNELARLVHGSLSERTTLFWTVLVLNILLGALGAICLLAAGHLILVEVIDVSAGLRNELTTALPIIAIGVPVITVLSILRGALEAHERFLAVNGLAVAGTVLFQTLPLAAAVWLRPTVPWLVAAAVASSLLNTVAHFAVCLKVLPIAGRPRIDLNATRRLIAYGSWVTVTSLISPVLATIDRVIIGAQLGAVAIAYYVVPFNLVSRMQIIPRSLARSLFPRLSMLPNTDATNVARRAGTGLLALTTPLVIVGLVMLEPFLTVWLGTDFASVSAPIGVVILVGIWINGIAQVPFGLLQAQGRPDLPAKLHAVEIFPYLGALFAGLWLAGLIGAAVAWTLRVTVDALALLWLARFSVLNWIALRQAAALVLVTAVGALTVFSAPHVRAVLGGTLVAISVFWAYREEAIAIGRVFERGRRSVIVAPRRGTL